MNATNETMPAALRQLLVDAAEAIETLTDSEAYPDEATPAVAIAGRLRDAAAGKPLTRSWDVVIDTAVNVEMPADVDPDSDWGIREIKAAAISKLLAVIEAGEFDIRCDEYCG
jgi:hypothetical protein